MQNSSAIDAQRLKAANVDATPWALQSDYRRMFLPDAGADDAPAPPPPVAVTKTDDGFSVRASNKTWNNNESQALGKRIDALKAGSTQPLSLPKAPLRLEPPLRFGAK